MADTYAAEAFDDDSPSSPAAAPPATARAPAAPGAAPAGGARGAAAPAASPRRTYAGLRGVELPVKALTPKVNNVDA